MAHPYAPPVDTLVALLRHRVLHQPDQLGYTFLRDGEHAAVDWTWSALDRRARAVAAWLQARNARGERAVLLFEEGLDFLAALFGCMYADVLAVPVHPPDPARLQRTLPRLRTIVTDADVRFALTTQGLRETTQPELSRIPALAESHWLAVDTLSDEIAAQWVDPSVTPDDIAYLQYTSGSTATPKGVRISHRNLLHQLADFDTGYDHRPDSVLVSWLPATHDLGLVYGRFMPLFVGFRCVFMSPVAFMQRPLRWMQAVSRFRGTHSPTPNFGLELVARKSNEHERASLDLSSLKVILNGAEPIREASEQLFVEVFRPHGLSPAAVTHAMGMSESTAKIVTEPIDRLPRFVYLDPVAYERNEVVLVPRGTPGARAVASCGRTVLDTRAIVVDPVTREDLGEDRVGELWVSGTTVAQGYFRNPEATAATFQARLADGTGPFLRTGDLAFVHGGEVYLTGRLKDVIIIRGQNHHPQDIEWTVAGSHPALRPNCAAAFGVERDGEEQLVLVTEVYPERVGDPEEVFGAVRQAVSEHGLQAASIGLIAPRALPKTSSGKIQRGLARERFQAGELVTLARWDAPRVPVSPETASGGAEEAALRAKLRRATGRRRARILAEHLVGLTAELLGVDPDDVETDRPLGELGLDSIQAVEMVERVGRALEQPVPGTLLFDHPTIDALSAFLADLAEGSSRD